MDASRVGNDMDWSVSTSNQMSPFLRLPLEIRLMIYEHAITVHMPVQPIQVAAGSNKFVWNHDWRCEAAYKQPGCDLFVKRAVGSLVFNSLLMVCRQVQLELNSSMAFYKLNQFVFYDVDSLHNYLVAITPERRRAIRKIELFDRDNFWAWSPTKLLTTSQQHVMSVLQDCDGLRDLTIHFTQIWPPHELLDAKGLNSKLYEWLEAARDSDGAKWPSLFSVPALHPIIHIKGLVIDLVDLSQEDFVYSPFERLRLASNWANNPRTTNLVKAVRNAFMARRLRLMKDKPGKDAATMTRLCKAIAKATVDFPGDVRVHHDRSKGMGGVFTRRTRSQARAEQSVSQWGTLNSGLLSKYDIEGFLAWEGMIMNLRWHGGIIECLMDWGRKQNMSWEPLDTLAGRGNAYTVYNFLVQTVSNGQASAATRSRILQSMPSPAAIGKILLHHISVEDFSRPASHARFLKLWAALEARWDRRLSSSITRARMEARKAEKQRLGVDNLNTTAKLATPAPLGAGRGVSSL